nr:RNA-directed DNA polymerase, eukaryota, reverse transcriptase zinc-binding domain protein [Tanacetum cinerariifolium]
MLWDYLSLVMENWNGEVIIMRDFNEVCKKAKRFGSVFNVQGADAFNMFISNASLEEVPLEGFDKLVKESWKAAHVADTNAIIKMMKKLKYLKEKIRVWNKTYKEGTSNNMRKLKADLAELDVVIDKGKRDEDVVMKRTNVVTALRDLAKLQSSEVAQRRRLNGLLREMRNLSIIMISLFNGVELASKKPIWVKWKNVLASKHKGGLGVSVLFALNRALMFKWVCRFVSQSSSLWAQVVKAIHGGDGKIGKKAKSTFSSLWLDIIHEVELLKDRGIDLISFIHKNLRNGAYTLFWEDAWRGGTAFRNLYPRLYALESSKNIDVASKMSHYNLSYSFRRDPRGGAEKAHFDLMLDKVESTLLADMRDRWTSSLECSGDFSVASVRKLLDGNMLPKVASKTRWIKVMPIKVNVHAWRVKLDIYQLELIFLIERERFCVRYRDGGMLAIWSCLHMKRGCSGPSFEDVLCVFNTNIKIDLLNNTSEIEALKPMKQLADIYFTKPCLACSRVFAGNIYGDHVRAGCVCIDLTGSSPFTQTRMTDFVPGKAVINATRQEDAVILLKRIRKFSKTQDIEIRVAVHIFNMIGFAITKGVVIKLCTLPYEMTNLPFTVNRLVKKHRGVPFSVPKTLTCNVKVVNDESPVKSQEQEEVAYEGEDEYENDTDPKFDLKVSDTKTPIQEQDDHENSCSDVEINNDGHLSDPGTSKKPTIACPKLKRSCSNIELKRVMLKDKIAPCESFEDLQRLANGSM